MTNKGIKVDEYFNKYQTLREQIDLPLKIKLYFSFLEVALNEDVSQKDIPKSQGFSVQLFTVFAQMSQAEKIYFLYNNLDYIRRQYEKIEGGVDHQLNLTEDIIKKNISVQGQMSDNLMGLVYWVGVKFNFEYSNKRVRVVGKKKQFELDLRIYLVRKSKKFKDTLVLESISEITPSEERKVSFSFKSAVFQEVFGQLQSCILEFRNQQLLKMSFDELSANQSLIHSEVSFVGKNTKAVNFLSSKNINDYLNFKDSVYKTILTTSFNFELIFKSPHCQIERSAKNPLFYKLQSNFECPAQVLKQEFIRQYNAQSYMYLIQSQKLEDFSQKYSAVYHKYMMKTSTNATILKQHFFIEEISQKSKAVEEVLFLKGIDNVMTKKLIDFILVKIKGLSGNKSKLMVIGGFNLEFQKQSKKKSQRNSMKIKKVGDQQNELIMMLLLEYRSMLFREEENENLSKLLAGIQLDEKYNNSGEQELFVTVLGACGQREETVIEVDDAADFQPSEMSSMGNIDFENKKESNSYLHHFYQLQPTQIEKNQSKEFVENHFLFTDWARKPRGGIICKDMTPINEQKKVAKFILKTMGRNVIESKGFLNTPLPVTIFKPESHLQSVARNLSFAPILLEKAVNMDPLNRMKMVVLFSLSVSSLSISVNKPFNPILGETHQAWIDGCPVYLQQVSHHPPIVSYYFIGRGYKVYGCIGAKASFGLNTIYGYSEQPNYVVFDDETQIQINFGMMSIKGIIFGEREFNLTGKMYAFDHKNKLFSDLKFGEEKKFFTSTTEPEDYLSGRIVRVNKKFVEIFYENSKAVYPQKLDIQEELSIFEGIWNGRVKFDGVELFDFGTAAACKVNDEIQPLPSDSRMREDIFFLKEGNIEASQNQKQRLQEIQRRDRKLRENN